MQQMIRNKIAYGFVALAFGMMLADVCRLAWASSDPAAPTTSLTLRGSKL